MASFRLKKIEVTNDWAIGQVITDARGRYDFRNIFAEKYGGSLHTQYTASFGKNMIIADVF
jgi:protocatechuate 3,4-dioxygenase beta subunit